MTFGRREIMARWRSTVLKASLVGLVPAVLVGATILYIAWTENLSMTIRDEDGVHWAYWLGLGASWAVPVFLLVTIVAVLILRFTRSAPRSSV